MHELYMTLAIAKPFSRRFWDCGTHRGPHIQGKAHVRRRCRGWRGDVLYAELCTGSSCPCFATKSSKWGVGKSRGVCSLYWPGKIHFHLDCRSGIASVGTAVSSFRDSDPSSWPTSISHFT